uniref:ANF_receptor domain-containing protein n=1 Tax=Caenorhabditis japonica TaxID=281687 RepID=A0A8R1E2X3_CAEJA
MVSMRSVGYGVQSAIGKKTFSQSGLVPLWESFTSAPDGMEEIAKSGASKLLVLDLSSEVQDKQYLQYLTKNVVYAVRAPPLSCSASACLAANATGMGAYARHLFDIIMIYGMSLTKLNSTDPIVYRDLEKLIPHYVTTFEGMTGLEVLIWNFVQFDKLAMAESDQIGLARELHCVFIDYHFERLHHQETRLQQKLGGISADNHYDIRVQDVRKY